MIGGIAWRCRTIREDTGRLLILRGGAAQHKNIIMRIQFQDEEVDVRFNLGVQISYEEITGEAFDLTTITTGKKAAALYYAVLNRSGWHGSMEQLLTDATGAELQSLADAVAEAVKTWADIPAVMREEPSEDSEQVKKK